MTPAERFLSRVDHRQTGPGRWLFRVPTRKDRHMSGTVRETDEGVLLVHDFGGDSVHDILDAIGLRAIAFEALIVAAAGVSLLAGHPFSPADRERLIVAVSRIQAALTAARVSHG